MHLLRLLLGTDLCSQACVAVYSTSNRNECQESSLGGKARPAYKDDNLTIICEPNVQKTWAPRPVSKPYRTPGPAKGITLLLLFYFILFYFFFLRKRLEVQNSRTNQFLMSALVGQREKYLGRQSSRIHKMLMTCSSVTTISLCSAVAP
jgi:hypothetical protein